MAFQWTHTHDAIRTRQYRSSTEPVPQQPLSAQIPPSLIPGNRHRQTFPATPTTNRLLYSGHGTETYPMPMVPDFPPVSSIPVNHSLYRDFQPPPLPLPLPPIAQVQSPVRPRQQQPVLVVPPLPPKTPISTPPSISPTVPPKPPPFVPPPPPTHTRPKLSTRSQSQPAPPPRPVPPPPPPPSKPMGARSASYKVTSTSSLLLLPHATPSVKPSPPAKRPPDTDATPPLTSLPVTSPTKGQLGMNEEEELKLVLELSAHTVREHANSLLSQDAELARALEASLYDSPPQPVQPRSQPDQFVMDSEDVPSSSSMPPVDAHSHDSNPSSHTPSPLLAPSPVDTQLRDDEAFARRLDAEYENERTSPTITKTHSTDPSPSVFPPLPRYADVVRKETEVERSESDAVASPRVQQVSPTSTPANDLLSVPDQANTPSRNSPSPAQRSSPRPEVLEITGSSTEDEEVLESASSSPQSSRPLATPNEFVEPELLYGISFGFNSPTMDNLEMRGSVPNIIALPYGKSPPMHIRAPSCRQLLKLMAKLSATRVEPSVEALSVTKGELQLRTVIQFFKLHQSSSDWRTVIYLTIDYPPPPDYRYTNMDINVLPYSYSLSTLPTLLRNGPDSNICKYYTVPATARTPFPKLPISMPSLAMYLTAALEDSRLALSDSSSGLRRLAKMVDQFYPNQSSQREVGDEEGRRRGGRTFIGRLMGRSPRPPQGGRNADVYDLVTPFIPDEWG